LLTQTWSPQIRTVFGLLHPVNINKRIMEKIFFILNQETQEI